MIRGSLSAGSAHAYALVSARNGVGFQRRTANGGGSTDTAGPASTAPMWLRATRAGTRVTAYYSTNGTSWTAIGSDMIALGTSAYIGLAVTSHNPSTRTTARVSNVTARGVRTSPLAAARRCPQGRLRLTLAAQRSLVPPRTAPAPTRSEPPARTSGTLPISSASSTSPLPATLTSLPASRRSLALTTGARLA